jgi:RND superfamily putative drug exporter
MLCLMFAEMSSTAGLGPRHRDRCRRHVPRGWWTLLPALLVIFGRWIFWPMRPNVPLGGAHPVGHLGQGRPADLDPPAGGVGDHGALLLVACLGLLRLDPTALDTDEQYTKDFESVVGPAGAHRPQPGRLSNQLLVVANADSVPAVAEAMSGVEGIGTDNTDIPPVDGTALLQAPVDGDPAGRPR